MLLDGARQLDERGEAAACCPGQPLVELGGRHVNLPAVEAGDQRLLEQVGAEDAAIGSLQKPELLPLDAGQVPRVLLQRPAGPLEAALLVTVGGADLGAPEFGTRFGELIECRRVARFRGDRTKVGISDRWRLSSR